MSVLDCYLCDGDREKKKSKNMRIAFFFQFSLFKRRLFATRLREFQSSGGFLYINVINEALKTNFQHLDMIASLRVGRKTTLETENALGSVHEHVAHNNVKKKKRPVCE